MVPTRPETLQKSNLPIEERSNWRSHNCRLPHSFKMRFFFRALWLSSVVTAELITITERRGCSPSAVFTSPVSNAPVYNSTQSANPSGSGSSLVAASLLPTGFGPVLGSIGPGSAAAIGGLSQSDKVDYLFWLEFAKAIRSAASIMPDDNSAFFIGSTALRGPPAGDNIPESYTNQGIYDIANSLRNDTSIFYTPGAASNS